MGVLFFMIPVYCALHLCLSYLLAPVSRFLLKSGYINRFRAETAKAHWIAAKIHVQVEGGTVMGEVSTGCSSPRVGREPRRAAGETMG